MFKPFILRAAPLALPLATLGVLTLLGPETVAAPAPSPAGAASDGFSAEFPLQAGDVIRVSVANHPEFSGDHVISTAGRITLPYTGTLTVAGKTIGEVQRLVIKAIETQLRRPSVAVTMSQARPRQAQILGSVTRPGPVDLRRGWRVSEVLAAAGGLAVEVDDVTATLRRGATAPQPLELKSILTRPEGTANVRVLPGDVLNFAARPVVRVTVSGDIAQNGQLRLKQNARVLDALVEAGGLGSFRPNEMTASLVREGKATSVDVAALYGPDVAQANIPLRDGDLLTFGARETNVSVFSLEKLVAQPGIFQIKGDATALKALVQAGNLVVPPEQVVVTIRRGEETIPVDVVRATNDPSADVPLQNGDVLLVASPNGPSVQIYGNVSSPGTYKFREGARLLDAITRAGDIQLAPAAASIVVVRTLPGNRQVTLEADALRLLEAKDLGQNLRLQDGDQIRINPLSRQTKTVFVTGEVTQPNQYELAENEGLIEALLRAGGAKPEAALSRVSIQHNNGEAQTVDLSESFRDGAKRPEVTLRAGDIVTVPRNTNQVLVMNAVRAPGYVTVPETGVLTINDALLKVGGPLPGAQTDKVAILRPKDGAIEERLVSLDEVRKGNLTINYPLLAGDVVWVPEAKARSTSLISQAGRALGFVGAILGLANRF